jgi:isocitrate lyase
VRDHEFILGVADPAIESLAETLAAMEAKGASGAEIDAFEANWVKTTKLVSFDEAAVAHLEAHGVDKAQISEYQQKVATDRDMGSPPVYWDWDIPRTREGFYHFRAGMEAATKRAIAFGAYADLLWAETGDANVKVCTDLGRAVRVAHPGKHLVYNLSPSFNWMAHGFTPETLKSFIWDIAKEGFVLQLVSLAGLHSTATISNELAKNFKTDGMAAYVELVQKREKALGVDVLTHQKWSGASYVDAILGSIQSGSSGSKSMGEGNTEGQFE